MYWAPVSICLIRAESESDSGTKTTRNRQIWSMNSIEDIARFLERQPYIVKALSAVEALGIDDCWIGAGLIRNTVWNKLHGFATDPIVGTDVDVVYCDAGDASLARDIAIEAQLFATLPGVLWSVHNQARMHIPNGDAPYRDVADAIRCWPETATAIAARKAGESVEVLAPHGVDDLIRLIVRPTPAFNRKMAAYRERIVKKDWARRWPRLTFTIE
jgi:uncharacterized protein